MSETPVTMEQQLLALNETVAILRARTNLNIEISSLLWKTISAIFVFSMQLGFSLLEAGTVRSKNTRNIMIKNVLDTCVCAVAFWLFGYSIGFGHGSKIIGWRYGDNSIAFAGAKEPVQWLFQFTFAATSTTIIAGAVAERTQLIAYLMYNFLLSSLIYPVTAHIIWSSQGLLSASRGSTILGTDGVLDDAGSLVVHVTGGVTSLVGAWMVGPRIGRFDIDGHPVPFKNHSMVFVAAGTIVLWFGFYGFNGGSVVLATQNPMVWLNTVAGVCQNTTLCAAFSGLTTFILTYRAREPRPEHTFNGVIGGLVAACATSSIVDPYAAALIGIGSGSFYLVGVWCIDRLGIDDVVMAAPTHLFCGSWGAVAVGFFSTRAGIRNAFDIAHPQDWGILHGGSGKLLGVQLLALVVVYAWVGSTSFILFYVLKHFRYLRVGRLEEEVGLDVAFHGGQDVNEEDVDLDSSHRAGNRVMPAMLRKRLSSVPFRNLSKIGRGSKFTWRQPFGHRGGGTDGMQSSGGTREVWHVGLNTTRFGQFALAMYEANYVMEDRGEVEASSSGVYLAVHDGHGGSETSSFLRGRLYDNLKDQFMTQGGKVSAEAIRAAYQLTEAQFVDVARHAFNETPHIATVGSCSITAIITSRAIWVANVGDCRAVLGQLKDVPEGSSESRWQAVQLSTDHNLSNLAIREEFIQEHADIPDAVVEKNGCYRVKGKITVTRSFGDLYLKSPEFNREPLFARFRVPEPYSQMLTAEPTISVRPLTPMDQFVIVASDGLFDLLSNQEAVDFVAKGPRKDISRLLVREALLRAAKQHEVPYQELLRMPSGQRRKFHDDITVVVFFFDSRAMEKITATGQWDQSVSFKGGQGPPLVLDGIEEDDRELLPAGSTRVELPTAAAPTNSVEDHRIDVEVREEFQ